ncbi:hypothetical protein ACOMHN_045357 [Nucella lapillus]
MTWLQAATDCCCLALWGGSQRVVVFVWIHHRCGGPRCMFVLSACAGSCLLPRAMFEHRFTGSCLLPGAMFEHRFTGSCLLPGAIFEHRFTGSCLLPVPSFGPPTSC